MKDIHKMKQGQVRCKRKRVCVLGVGPYEEVKNDLLREQTTDATLALMSPSL